MTRISRRGLIAGGAAGAASAAGAAGGFGMLPAGQATTASPGHPATESTQNAGSRGGPAHQQPITLPPDDPRHADLAIRGNNARFHGNPADTIQLVSNTEHVVAAVQQAVDEDKRLTVRSGGHCFEDFVDSPDGHVLIDMSPMDQVRFDRRRRSFEIGPGILLGDLYQRLYYSWGVTIPAGGCLGVGAGGHLSGGGYGPLSRLYGSVVDWLEAVEVVTVDERGRARAITASSDPDDPHHDLWWAHTGGGGGNFGVVTRYWMGDPNVKGPDGSDPSAHLPRPPATLLTTTVLWDWSALNRTSFVRLIGNFCRFFERHAGADSPYASLYSPLLLPHRASQDGFLLSIQLDGTLPNAEKLLQDYVTALSEGVDAEPTVLPNTPIPFMTGTLTRSIPVTWDKTRHKVKAGYLRKSYTDAQLGVIYDALTEEKTRNATLLLVPYGGKVNTVAPDATALPQRDSILKMVFQVDWTDPAQDQEQLQWARQLYRKLYADTGGVPVPNEINDGSYINYPDVDLADPEQNTSGVPWHALYYKDNYPRLRRIKQAYDPKNVFRHSLSIEPAKD